MPTESPPTRLPLHLTDRDRVILKRVFDFRILAADQIQALIPGSDQQILRRLQKLTAHAYLLRHPRTSAHLPYLYQVTQKAGLELTPEFGIEPDQVKKRAQKISAHDLLHVLMVSRVQYAVTLAVAARPEIELVECLLEDELPVRSVAYQDGARQVQAKFRHDLLMLLKYQGRYMTVVVEADRSTERGKVVTPKIAHYHHFWLQERDKARRGEPSFAFGGFRVLWTTRSQARLENLRRYSTALNGGKGSALHWFTCEQAYADPPRFFEPIWHIGRADDAELHSLLETRHEEANR